MSYSYEMNNESSPRERCSIWTSKFYEKKSGEEESYC